MAEARAKLAEEGKARVAGFLTASDIDPLSAAFRKLVGLEEIQGKFKFMKSKKALLRPRLALLDLMRNQYALSGEFELESRLFCCLCRLLNNYRHSRYPQYPQVAGFRTLREPSDNYHGLDNYTARVVARLPSSEREGSNVSFVIQRSSYSCLSGAFYFFSGDQGCQAQ